VGCYPDIHRAAAARLGAECAIFGKYRRRMEASELIAAGKLTPQWVLDWQAAQPLADQPAAARFL
jgi:hypothetical protein